MNTNYKTISIETPPKYNWSFPDEIVENVIGFLDTKSLAVASRINRQFKELVLQTNDVDYHCRRELYLLSRIISVKDTITPWIPIREPLIEHDRSEATSNLELLPHYSVVQIEEMRKLEDSDSNFELAFTGKVKLKIPSHNTEADSKDLAENCFTYTVSKDGLLDLWDPNQSKPFYHFRISLFEPDFVQTLAVQQVDNVLVMIGLEIEQDTITGKLLYVDLNEITADGTGNPFYISQIGFNEMGGRCYCGITNDQFHVISIKKIFSYKIDKVHKRLIYSWSHIVSPSENIQLNEFKKFNPCNPRQILVPIQKLENAFSYCFPRKQINNLYFYIFNAQTGAVEKQHPINSSEWPFYIWKARDIVAYQTSPCPSISYNLIIFDRFNTYKAWVYGAVRNITFDYKIEGLTIKIDLLNWAHFRKNLFTNESEVTFSLASPAFSGFDKTTRKSNSKTSCLPIWSCLPWLSEHKKQN